MQSRFITSLTILIIFVTSLGCNGLAQGSPKFDKLVHDDLLSIENAACDTTIIYTDDLIGFSGGALSGIGSPKFNKNDESVVAFTFKLNGKIFHLAGIDFAPQRTWKGAHACIPHHVCSEAGEGYYTIYLERKSDWVLHKFYKGMEGEVRVADGNLKYSEEIDLEGKKVIIELPVKIETYGCDHLFE